jgi:hypothetical protein
MDNNHEMNTVPQHMRTCPQQIVKARSDSITPDAAATQAALYAFTAQT